MICYKDMTFCTYKDCKKFSSGCHRAFTEEVKAAADKWWGRMEGDAPVCMFAEYPNCFERQEIKDGTQRSS